MKLDRSSDEYRILLKTIYGEARGESKEIQIAVAWVIYNRTKLNMSYWGGSTLAGVCKHPYQFKCWNGLTDITMTDTRVQQEIDNWLPDVFNEASSDPTGGSTYYYNPNKESCPDWLSNKVVFVRNIDNYQFYKNL